MKGAAHALSRVVMHHRGGHACNKAMTLMTRAITVITGAVTLAARSYYTCIGHLMRGGELPGQGAIGMKRRQGGFEISGPSAFILWLPHLICSGEAPGQGAVGAS